MDKVIRIVIVMDSHLRITSVNCKSVRNKTHFIRNLCDVNDIVLLQETWLLPTDLHFLNSIHNGFNAIGTSAVDLSTTLIGRPHGGLGILHKMSLKCIPIECDSPRLCAIQIFTQNSTLLLVNVYMPCYTTDEKNFPEYCELLGKIHSIVEDSEVADCLIIGDFNANPTCRFGTELEQFCSEYKYKYVDKLMLPNTTYTFVSDAHHTTSWLDHCIATENAFRAVRNMCIDLTIDWTDHRPISLELEIQKLTITTNVSEPSQTAWSWRPKSWECVEKYKSSVTQKLNQLMSRNFNLNDATAIDSMYSSIIKIMQSCATECFKGNNRNTRKKNTVPGWNKYVAEKYATSLQSLALWQQAGRPTTGPVVEERKRHRAAFKRALKTCHQNQEQIVMDQIALDMKHKNFGKFWHSINKIIKPSSNYPSHIDGTTSDRNIADHFNKIFCQPAPVNRHVLEIPQSLPKRDIHISVDDIVEVIKQTAGGKSPGRDGLTIEHIRHGGLGVYHVLSILFTAILKTGHLPMAFTDTVIIPICKNRRKNISSSTNYRPIALANMIARLLEKVLFKVAAPFMETSDCQYGFKSNLSTSTAIYVLKQVVGYYKARKTSVIACYLDLSKAFDRVDHDLLWQKLYDRKVPGQVVQVLKNWYLQQKNRVRWKNEYSAPLELKCGVRQGGSMSPPLFNLYMDGLSEKLTQTGVGCSINGTATNHISYADDMVLLAPSISAMRKLLAVCEKYAEEHNMMYNPDKSVYMIFKATNCCTNLPPLTLYEAALEQVEEVKYLGHMITSDLSDHADIERQRRAIAVRGNMLARRFSRCSDSVKAQLFISYCTSVYTTELWTNYTKAAMSEMRVQYNDAWRVMFRLPRWCSASSMFAEGRAPCWQALLRSRSAAVRTALHRSDNALVAAVREWHTSPIHRTWRAYHTPIT